MADASLFLSVRVDGGPRLGSFPSSVGIPLASVSRALAPWSTNDENRHQVSQPLLCLTLLIFLGSIDIKCAVLCVHFVCCTSRSAPVSKTIPGT